mmetsp:Transcript_36541/g.37937  ORF Transcript_36541/g.37937 Transcript_36541/m.37937 type:complete len:146 (+) Transcript_36541:5-442(+)
MKPHEILVPMKFYVLMTQFILTIVVYYTKESNVSEQIEHYKTVEELVFEDEENYLNNLLIASYAFMSFELLTLLLSLTIFLNRIICFQIVFHAIADLCLCWFIWQSWISEKFWIVLTLGCIVPVLLEIIGMFYSIRKKQISHNSR